MYAIGCTLAAVIIVPFLEKANEGGSVEAPCPGFSILSKMYTNFTQLPINLI